MAEDDVAPGGVQKKSRKSQKREERRKRREERRLSRRTPPPGQDGAKPERPRRKSLPAYMAKNQQRIRGWLKDYLTLLNRADDAGVPYVMERRLRLKDDYVEISWFLDGVERPLEEDAPGGEEQTDA